MKTFTIIAAAALTLAVAGTAQAEAPKVASDPFVATKSLEDVPGLAIVAGAIAFVLIAAASDGESGSGTIAASGTGG